MEVVANRTIIIGDIHGCYQEFITMLDSVQLEEETDRLILLGDLIDRGPDSYLVLEKARQLQESMQERFCCLMGNHERMAVDAFDLGERNLWIRNGGNATLKSFLGTDARIQDYLDFMSELPLYYETEDWICVHAGIHQNGPRKTDEHTFLWDREIARGGLLYRGRLLLYGHTPMKSIYHQDEDGKVTVLRPGTDSELPKTGSISLDTGCVFGGKLSAMIIADGRYQIKQVPESDL